MTKTADGFFRTIFHTACLDLRPFEGRFEMAWRVAALCALAALVFMTYGIPLAPIGCYLILFLMKPDGTESAMMATAVAVLVSVVVVILLYLARWTIDVPLLRMVVIVVGSYLFVYLGAASTLGPIGNIIALVIGFAMTLLSDVPFGEAATRALLYAWLMAAVPMGLIIVFNLFLGRSPVRLLRQSLTERLHAVALAAEQPAQNEHVRSLMLEGNDELKKQVTIIRLLHLVPSVESRYLSDSIYETYRLLLAVTALPADTSLADRTVFAVQSRLAIEAVNGGPPHIELYTPATASVAARETAAALAALCSKQPVATEKPAKQAFFFDDALSNPNYQRFALKTTAAATISYLIYTAIDWQGIHTAMITCYVAALSTTAETLHKLTLRIVGCLIGAALGAAAILFLIPHMTGIGSLVILVFLGTLVAGWVSSGSERIAYAGIQIGLAFLLTVLQGFGPDIKLSVASDRIIGILVGNLVIYLIFTRVWPLSVVTVVRKNLETIFGKLAQIAIAFRTGHSNIDELSQAIKALDDAKESLRLALFEPRQLRPDDDEIKHLRRLIADAENLCAIIAFGQDNDKPPFIAQEIVQMQHQLKKGSTV